MNKKFEFNEEDFNDPKKFMKKFRIMLKEIKEGLSEQRGKELDEYLKKTKGKTEMFEIRNVKNSRTSGRRSFGMFEDVMNITEFMIINGIESFFSIPRRPGKSFDKNIDEVYEHYATSEQLEFTESFISNVKYLLEYYVEDEQYEKCVVLQWLQEQYDDITK